MKIIEECTVCEESWLWNEEDPKCTDDAHLHRVYDEDEEPYVPTEEDKALPPHALPMEPPSPALDDPDEDDELDEPVVEVADEGSFA